MFTPGFEPGTFRVIDRCVNQYTTTTSVLLLTSLDYDILLFLFFVFTGIRMRSRDHFGPKRVARIW